MSRFSPQLQVQDRSGEILGDAISQAFANLAHNRRQAKLAKQQEAEQQRATELQDLQLAERGLFRGTAPMAPVKVSGGTFLDALTSGTPERDTPTPRMSGPSAGDLSTATVTPASSQRMTSVTPMRARYTQMTPGIYRDQQVLDDRRASDFQEVVSRAVAERRALEAADPEGTALTRERGRLGLDLLRAQVDQAQAPKPAQAPVRGTPEYLKAREDELRLESRFRQPTQGTPYQILTTDQGFVAVDPRNPRSQLNLGIRPPAQGAAAGLTAAQAKEVKSKQTALINLDKVLGELDAMVKQHGVEVWPSDVKARMETLARDAQLQLKDAAALGAITGPDMAVLEGMIRNPTSLTQFARGGASGARAGYDEMRTKLRREAGTMSEVYGVDVPTQLQPTAKPKLPPLTPEQVNRALNDPTFAEFLKSKGY